MSDLRKSETVAEESQYKKRSQMLDIWHSLRRNKGALLGIIILGMLFIILIVTLFMPYEMVLRMNPFHRYTPPNWQYPFGTDFMGRNQFHRVLFGTRYSLAIGFGSAGLGALVGVTLGAFAGYFGKLTDEIIMRFSDILASIPGIILGMVIVSALGNSLRNVIIAVGVASIPFFIRISRASILTVRNQEFVEAAHAIGMSHFRIIFRHVLPNGLSPIIVMFSVILGMSIITAASLSFLGWGIPAPAPEWGTMMNVGRVDMLNAPFLMTFPGIFIMITVLAFNLIGDGLRDALDPKLKK
ncbi:MAG: ABC transporter permease [Oscillospiraceae bacterium]|nr:ABC transporter permease [Oscillospiraceae bacterium]